MDINLQLVGEKIGRYREKLQLSFEPMKRSGMCLRSSVSHSAPGTMDANGIMKTEANWRLSWPCE